MQAHEMLFGLVAREDGDRCRHAVSPVEQALDQHLAERAGAAGYEDALAFKSRGQAVTSWGRICIARSATISLQEGTEMPVASVKREPFTLLSIRSEEHTSELQSRKY